MDVGDPEHNDQDDEEQEDQAEDKNHIALYSVLRVGFYEGVIFGYYQTTRLSPR